MTHTNDDEAMARLAALSAKLRSQDQILSRSGIAEITPTREVVDRREAVPVAWGESYDGGAFFNTVSLTKTRHHTYPLYAYPPQPSVSVAEADQFDRIHATPDAVARLVEAARAALNYLENTEGEFGITLGSATGLRAALAAMEASPCLAAGGAESV